MAAGAGGLVCRVGECGLASEDHVLGNGLGGVIRPRRRRPAAGGPGACSTWAGCGECGNGGCEDNKADEGRSGGEIMPMFHETSR